MDRRREDGLSHDRTRVTARVLLLDPAGRILLMYGRLPGAPAGAWFTIGGGVEPGESPREAAAREIVEETGFTDFVLGPCLWTGALDIHDRLGPLRVTEYFFAARAPAAEPSRSGWLDIEHELVDAIRWWTLADLARCPDPVFPPDLVDRLRALLP
ncbi:MAG: NUDIX domain-containing protein [Caulobacteraceae bacterium]